jgi:hypothetical protein
MILMEDFEGIDEQDLEVYNQNWTVTKSVSSTVKIDTDQKKFGLSSARFYSIDSFNRGLAVRKAFDEYGSLFNVTVYMRAEGPDSPAVWLLLKDNQTSVLEFALYTNFDIK